MPVPPAIHSICFTGQFNSLYFLFLYFINRYNLFPFYYVGGGVAVGGAKYERGFRQWQPRCMNNNKNADTKGSLNCNSLRNNSLWFDLWRKQFWLILSYFVLIWLIVFFSELLILTDSWWWWWQQREAHHHHQQQQGQQQQQHHFRRVLFSVLFILFILLNILFVYNKENRRVCCVFLSLQLEYGPRECCKHKKTALNYHLSITILITIIINIVKGK